MKQRAFESRKKTLVRQDNLLSAECFFKSIPCTMNRFSIGIKSLHILDNFNPLKVCHSKIDRMRSMGVCPLNFVVCRRMATKLPRNFPMRFSTQNWSRFVVFTFNFLPKLAVEDRLSHTLAAVWMPNKPWSVWTTWTPMSRSILAMAMSVSLEATYPTTETWLTTLGTTRTVLETERAQTSWMATAMTTMTR